MISIITLSHHFCLIHGVQKAPTVTALEFVNFSKIVFVLILSYCLLGTKIYNNKILGALIIAITLILFNFRADMMREIVRTFGIEDFDGFERNIPVLNKNQILKRISGKRYSFLLQFLIIVI